MAQRYDMGVRLGNDVALITDLPAAITCSVFAYSQGGAAEYARAVAVIRAELPPLLSARTPARATG